MLKSRHHYVDYIRQDDDVRWPDTECFACSTAWPRRVHGEGADDMLPMPKKHFSHGDDEGWRYLRYFNATILRASPGLDAASISEADFIEL